MKTVLLGSAALSLLTVVSAFGADLGPLPPPPLQPPPPAFTWTSCYGGLQVSGGLGTKDVSDTAGVLSPVTGFTTVNLNVSGVIGGGQIGCDYEFTSNWVLGIEGAVSGGNIGAKGTFTPPGIPGDSTTFKESSDFLMSVTGRVGYAWDRLMIYGKGGIAWVDDRYSAFDSFVTYDYEATENRMGWTAGAGIEWAFWNDLSAKLEYDYYGFGQRDVLFIDSLGNPPGPLNVKQNIQVIKLGLNFHIFGGP
jgi:outer membrane immunogenic protein